MSRQLQLAGVIVALWGLSGWPARGQVPFARDLVPKRASLTRLGLERHWMATVPLAGDEHLLGISLAEGFVFAQTNRGFFHAYDSESGQRLWTTRLGTMTARVRPASVNSFAVFATNLNLLYALDRRTGVMIWKQELNALPSSSTSCDEERVMVGLATGKLHAFGLKVTVDEQPRLSDHPIPVWNWQTNAAVETRPLPAGRFVVFGSDDAKVYVALSNEPKMLYRVPTGGAIGAGFGTHGTRLLMVPSADRNLYGIDLMTASVLWIFSSGSPIKQAPLVAGDDVYVVNSAGQFSSIDPKNGTPRWTATTQGGTLLAIGAKRIYLVSHDGDLFIVDRATGQMVADPRSTFERIGLNLRSYPYVPTNRLNDRLYFATRSGFILALREAGQTTPRPLRDPRALPFGYVPAEGISLKPATPPTPPAASGDLTIPPPGAEPEQ